MTKPDWGLSLQFGRQPFEDVRQWWYDADLDGVRAIYRVREFAIEGSASREALVQKNLLDRTREEAIDNYISSTPRANRTRASVSALTRS